MFTEVVMLERYMRADFQSLEDLGSLLLSYSRFRYLYLNT